MEAYLLKKKNTHIVEDYQDEEESKYCTTNYDGEYDDEEEGYNDLIKSLCRSIQ